jgi:hypothetical protein
MQNQKNSRNNCNTYNGRKKEKRKIEQNVKRRG